jgi:hypothetical protein
LKEQKIIMNYAAVNFRPSVPAADDTDREIGMHLNTRGAVV